ncbi:alpha/beta fold hydrolase [Pantoea coffeiphila]|uniref:Alpha/beta hydrolase n=1 Tax=Pantoea coffeiphila TaxID=1465635 RepID=A0A2S9ICD4_9GAMM|nr:alpha/beta hydrolase [Pantoea coffeiphila]PRD15460.1 alpha/beta hydrolase [Pantoea coffeiphila]
MANPTRHHHYLRVNGSRLHCVTQGHGPAILLIPGWPQTWYTWRHVMEHLARAGYTAVAVDPPGTGESDAPTGGFDTGNIAAQLVDAMSQLGHQRYPVIGHDIGMWVGYAMGADFPQRVHSLLLTEAVIPGLAPAPEIFVSPQENIFLWHFMFNQLSGLPEALIAGRERLYLSYMFDKWSWRRERVAAEVYIDAYSVPGKLEAGFNYYRAIPETIRQNQQRAATPLSMPVLAIGAEHATRDAPAQTMKKVAPDLRSAMVSDCGHFITEECPDEFCALIAAFLQEKGYAAR